MCAQWTLAVNITAHCGGVAKVYNIESFTHSFYTNVPILCKIYHNIKWKNDENAVQ